MESEPFTGFFRNAPFDKRSVLWGFWGFSPLFCHGPPDHIAKGGFWGLSGSGAAGIVKRGGGIDGWDRMDAYLKS